MTAGPMMRDVSDPLHTTAGPSEHWTTANLGEAMPGVATPLSATVWGDFVDKGLVAGAIAMGAVAEHEREVIGPPGDRLVRLFHGRAAVKADFLALLGDRMPGTSGQEVARAFFGSVPETMTFSPTARRYPYVAIALPRSFVTQPRKVRTSTADWSEWWARSIRALDAGDAALATALLREATDRLEQAVITQSVAVLTCVQPVYDALEKVVTDAGAGDFSVLSAPPGGAESAVVADIWRASRGELTVPEVAARHGFHGPNEGELSARVWREDLRVLERLVEQYRERGEEDAPARKEAELARVRTDEERILLAAVGRLQRPAVRGLLRLTKSRIPLRGMAKRSMLQSLDVARAAARVIGSDLARADRLENPDDVFFLTLQEALAPPQDLREIVEIRRAARDRHADVIVPEHWRGNPEPQQTDAAAATDLVSGEGVSRGIVEGIVRVVDDPSFAEVEPDEILVAPTTDPSWSSIMFISSALVVDIGGALSHAAVVARELGIPCVVNTRSGSRDLHTGDRVRVDGSAGTVEILERCHEQYVHPDV
jgi:pyruvate,water dikinase